MKVKDLSSGFYLFGNRGNVMNNDAHIAHRGSATLCGVPMLSHNHAHLQEMEEANCDTCNERYKEMKVNAEDGVMNDEKTTT